MLRVLRYFPLQLSHFQSVVTLECTKKRITYLDKDKEVGYIEYKPCDGKICLFFITNERYRDRGLGTQILNHVFEDMKIHQTKRVWLVTNKCPHPFWEKNGFTYTKNPDISVTYHGYTRTL
jgi:hypothetical protein